MPDLKDELRQLADEAARQARPWPVADVIREGDRRRRRVNPRAPELAVRRQPGRRWPGWVTPLAAAAAVIAVAAVVTTVSGAIRDSGPAGNRPGASAVYAVYQSGTVIPISTATSRPGKLIHIRGFVGAIAITPNGKTIYAGTDAVVPVSTASGKPGKPIDIGRYNEEIAITPNGKTAYVATSEEANPMVTPINTATNTPGKPIRIGLGLNIAMSPDGTTLYAENSNKIVPISTTTNKPGKPIRVPPHAGPANRLLVPGQAG